MVETFDPAEISLAMEIASRHYNFSDADVVAAKRILDKWSTEIEKRSKHLKREIRWNIECARSNEAMRELVRAGK